MADITRGPNSRNIRDGDIVTPVTPATAFTSTREPQKKSDNTMMSFLAWSMMASSGQNHLNANNPLEALGYYIPENVEIQNNATVTINGQTISANNFYTGVNGGTGAGTNFGSVFRGPNVDMSDFFARTPRGSNVAIDGSFQQAFGIVVASEGGFSNHKADRGGATIFGIASRSNPAEYDQIMSHINAGRNQAAMDLTMRVYKEKYWDEAGIGNIRDPDARLVAFDAAINHGAGYARRMIRNTGEDADAMLRYRANTYIQIVENNPSQRVFLNGWRNRLAHLNDLTHGPSAPNVQMASSRTEHNQEASAPSPRTREVASTLVRPPSNSPLGNAFQAADQIRVPENASRALDQAADVARDIVSKGQQFMARLPSLDLNPFN